MNMKFNISIISSFTFPKYYNQARTQKFSEGGPKSQGGGPTAENKKFCWAKSIYPYPPTGVFYPKGGARAPWATPLGTCLIITKIHPRKNIHPNSILLSFNLTCRMSTAVIHRKDRHILDSNRMHDRTFVSHDF